MREFLNKHGYIIAAALLVLAAIFALWFNHSGKNGKVTHPNTAFFIDQETNEESIRPVTDVPPLLGASGKPTIVEAMKFHCKGQKNLVTLYLFKYTPEAQDALANGIREDPHVNEIINKGQLFRSPKPDSAWYPIDSPEAQALLGAKCEDGSNPEPASP